MSAFDKLEYELFAVLALYNSFPEFIADPVKGESPDWQDEKAGIGIEVSRAESSHIGYTYSIANRFLGKKRSEIPPHILQDFRGSLTFDKRDRLFAISDSKGLFDGDRHIRLALDRAKEKLDLLSGPHFRCFETNGLFLYLTMSLLDDDAQLFLSEYTKLAKQFLLHFDHVFLMALDSIANVDIRKGQVTEYPLPDGMLAQMNQKTHELRKASDWKNGTGFFDLFDKKERNI